MDLGFKKPHLNQVHPAKSLAPYLSSSGIESMNTGPSFSFSFAKSGLLYELINLLFPSPSSSSSVGSLASSSNPSVLKVPSPAEKTNPFI